MKFKKSFLVLLFPVILMNCSDQDEDFYSFEESATRLLVAYSAKDAECGSNRQITSFVPGRTRKKDVDNCVLSIAVESCSFWTQAGDPVPFACKAIEYRLK
ncbi:hypothetical protein EHQ27_13760 [Leptospira wolffii]|uniref:Lipoprotein n=2 Tax=Leptospira wolffii TaxID=409998 RepID=A0A2M9ZFB1_9LEPT|nr:hypothetical protein [Leptospira wolffii]PJZ67093.1 hypothetical protein CH371_03180 [Leptospira wolffii]TGK62068.1 hypothetical protein EHQ32_04315 [Leptospira wolffii]TGK68670.1 hypothetical protein EHQ27_13760 [Leptospira wolffii]TGK74546.1 hypothetical protein EHQ35_09460 [Leptospira wolffii]TGL31878.1 hypothetical protein EHQ57_03215 [Leptospira wolffii]